MADLVTLTSILRTRTKLKAYADETDIIYKISDPDLQEIIDMSVKAHNGSYTVTTLPEAEVCFVLWLSEIELFTELAAGNAKFFKIEAQGAELNKQQRVDHYLKLIEGLERRYNIMWQRFVENNPDRVTESELIISSPHYLERAYRLRERPSISLSITGSTLSTIDLTWDGFNRNKPLNFKLYCLEGSNLVIVDEYDIEELFDGIPINKSSELIYSTADVYRNKYRVKNLKSATSYTFAIIAFTDLGHWGYSEVTASTV
jgi:hypothetical protein